MNKEENQCLTKKESETLNLSLSRKSDKLVITTRITWPYKERASLQPNKFKDLKMKWKNREDKP